MQSQVQLDAAKIVGVRGEIQISNQQAYEEYVKLSNDPILNEKRFITVSDGRTLSFGYPRFESQIKDLPDKEKRLLMCKKKVYLLKHLRRNTMYTRAYGTHVGHDGVQKKKNGLVSPLLQRREEIIELFGRMFSIKEVHEVCLKDWDLKVTTKTLSIFRDVNKQIIFQKIEEYKKSYDNIRLGHKRPRIEELSWMYEKRKRLYQTSGKIEDHRLMLQTLEQLRKEVEGDTLRIDGNMNYNLELTIKNQIENDLLKHVLIKEIVISRVAAKLGLDSARMLTSIKNSFYRSRLEAVEDISHEEITYPSAATYDFNKIEAIQRQQEIRQEIEDKNFQEAKILPKEIETSANRVKLALIAKLKSKQEDVNKIKNSVMFNNREQD